jgi:O-antigen ligase
MTVAIAATRTGISANLAGMAPAALAFAVLTVTARSGGAFLPSTWGWSALGPLLAATAGVSLADRLELDRIDLAFLGLLGLLGLWTALSAVWSESVPRTVSEVERDLVYVSTVAGLLLLMTRRHVGALAGGIVAATTGICGFGLATRLFPDRFGLAVGASYRLARPLGYWNGMGIVAAMGMLLALAVAVSARSKPVRVAAAAATPIFVSTLYFTFSRGAWVALLLGLALALVVAPGRKRLALHAGALTPLLGAVVWLCSRPRGLNDSRTTLEDAVRDGHWLASLVPALALAAGAVPLLCDRRVPRLSVPRRLRLALLVGLGLLALAVPVAGLVRVGGPDAAWKRASAGFRASGWSPSTKPGDRLFTVSGRSRVDYWRVAWRDAAAHPWLGSGAGTFELRWTRDRPLNVGVLDAHNLYLETLAELGPFGLGLLCAFLAAPLVALRRARALPLGPAAAGAYVAFLVDAGLDWHWELPTVTATALSCAVVVVVSARRQSAARRVRPAPKMAMIAGLSVLVAAAVVVHIGNTTIAHAQAAAAGGQRRHAVADARLAMRLAPWSATPWRILATAQESAGDLAAARASLETAIAKDPQDWQVWQEFAQVSGGASRRAATDAARRLNPLGCVLEASTTGETPAATTAGSAVVRGARSASAARCGTVGLVPTARSSCLRRVRSPCG